MLLSTYDANKAIFIATGAAVIHHRSISTFMVAQVWGIRGHIFEYCVVVINLSLTRKNNASGAMHQDESFFLYELLLILVSVVLFGSIVDF